MTHAQLLSDVVNVLADPRMPEPKRRVLAAAMLLAEATESEATAGLAEAVCDELEKRGRGSKNLQELNRRSAACRQRSWHDGHALRIFAENACMWIGVARKRAEQARPALVLVNGGEHG